MRINIEDLNYQFSHEELNITKRDTYTSNLGRLVKSWSYLILRGVYSIKFFFNRKYYDNIIPCDYMILAYTSNNNRALYPIHEKLKNSQLYFSKDLPLGRTWLYAVFFSPVVFFRYLKASHYLKKVYASEFINLCRVYGYYFGAKSIFKKLNPKYFIVANDHSPLPRTFFRVAQLMNIKTVYMQHASVGAEFPPLEYDYAFLDGQESLDKYTANNKKCISKIILLGSPRFDIIKSFNSNSKDDGLILKVGIAINSLALLPNVEKLIMNLQINIENIKISIRPHPNMDMSFWREFSRKYNIEFSDAQKENPFLFIKQNDIFIAGESSFHLDVVLSGKTSLFYNFSDRPVLDGYQYLKNKLIFDITDISDLDLCDVICNKNSINPDYTKLIQYYVANYNTPDWGKSAENIASYLAKIGL